MTTKRLNESKNFEDWYKSVYENDFERLYRYAFSITKNKPQAEDVVSEIFTNVWNTRPFSNSIEELKAYLYVAVKRQAIRVVSKTENNISQLHQNLTLNLVESVNPENLLIGKELNGIIEEIIDNFPPHTQLVYKMIMNRDYSYQEICEELGITKRTAEKHMSNALFKLRSRIKKHLENDDRVYSFLRKASSFTILISLINHFLLSSSIGDLLKII